MNEFFFKSKMNFKKFFLLVPLYILPYHSRYKSFLTRFSIVHTSSCFPNEIRRIILEERRIVGHRSLDNGLLIRSIHLPQILSSRFIRPHHVYHVPFYRTSELRSLSNPPLTCWSHNVPPQTEHRACIIYTQTILSLREEIDYKYA